MKDVNNISCCHGCSEGQKTTLQVTSYSSIQSSKRCRNRTRANRLRLLLHTVLTMAVEKWAADALEYRLGMEAVPLPRTPFDNALHRPRRRRESAMRRSDAASISSDENHRALQGLHYEYDKPHFLVPLQLKDPAALNHLETQSSIFVRFGRRQGAQCARFEDSEKQQSLGLSYAKPESQRLETRHPLSRRHPATHTSAVGPHGPTGTHDSEPLTGIDLDAHLQELASCVRGSRQRLLGNERARPDPHNNGGFPAGKLLDSETDLNLMPVDTGHFFSAAYKPKMQMGRKRPVVGRRSSV